MSISKEELEKAERDLETLEERRTEELIERMHFLRTMCKNSLKKAQETPVELAKGFNNRYFKKNPLGSQNYSCKFLLQN